MDLKTKSALITGGTGDLGKVVTQAFLRAGAKTAAAYIYGHEWKALQEQSRKLANRPHGYKCDVTQENEVRKTLDAVARDHRGLDIVVNLVGGYLAGPTLPETSEADWDYMLQLNLKGTFLVSRHAIPHLVKRGGGRIINISSRSGLRGEAGAAAYSAAKAGVLRLTEALAEELRDHHITANAILPSILDTPANRKVMPGEDPARWVRPEDVASLILYLCTDAAGAISGAGIPIYGRA